MQILRWIRSAVGESVRGVWLLTAVRCAMAAIAVCYALLMQASIDSAVAGDSSRFFVVCGLFGAALMVQVALSAASKYLSESVGAKVDNAVRGSVAGRLFAVGHLPEGRHTGDAASVLTSDVAAVRDGLVGIAPEALSMAVRFVAALVLLCAIAPALAAFFVIAGVLCAGASVFMRAWLKRLHAESQQAEAGMRAYLQEALESLVVVRSFGAEGKVGSVFGGLMGERLRARLRLAGGRTASATAFNLAMQLSYLAGFAWGCYGILCGTVTYGTLMAVVQLVGQIRAPFAGFSGLFAQYTAMSASAERLRALAGEGRPRLVRADTGRFEALEFSSVRYGYRGVDEPVLDGFNMTVRRGEFVAVVGPSGVGKSTALMLALGMDEPERGSVRVRFGKREGVDDDASDVARRAAAAAGSDSAHGIDADMGISSASVGRVSNTASAHAGLSDVVDASRLAAGVFAYVPQGNMLMSGTVRDVICFGCDVDAGGDVRFGDRCVGAVGDGRVREAARAAQALDFVEALPNGFDTVLGEHGAGLSEGQMQRLAVARAVCCGAPVLLLDEATSALDEQTERRMLAALRKLDRTVVVVTHRPAALEMCDRVVRLG